MTTLGKARGRGVLRTRGGSSTKTGGVAGFRRRHTGADPGKNGGFDFGKKSLGGYKGRDFKLEAEGKELRRLLGESSPLPALRAIMARATDG